MKSNAHTNVALNSFTAKKNIVLNNNEIQGTQNYIFIRQQYYK